MANERFQQALSRIEGAAARIEAGVASGAALGDRHARLRAETVAVLARLDRLIGLDRDDAA